MAKVHYKVDAKKRASFQKDESGKVNISIKDVFMIEENNVIKVDNGNFVEGSEKSKGKISAYDKIFIAMLETVVALILILLLFLVWMKSSSDLKVLTSNYIDNTIGGVALLFGFCSIPVVKKFMEKKLPGPRIIVKLLYFIIIVGLPFFITASMMQFGFSSSIGNICGIIGIIISLFTW